MKKLPIYELKLNPEKKAGGMSIISLVDSPAMEVSAVKLGEQKPVKLQQDPYKQYLTSAVIIPDKLIYRNDQQQGEYYIRFNAADIEPIRDHFFQNGALNLSNKNHVEADVVDAHLVEAWTITDPANDKAAALGFDGLPAGTLMATYKVNDKAFWDSEVLSGNVTGFSLEGIFSQLEVHNATHVPATDRTPLEELEALVRELEKMAGI